MTLFTIFAALYIIRKVQIQTEYYQKEADKYRLLIDSTMESIYMTDTQRRIVLWNRAAEKLTGYSEREVIGRECREVLNHTDSEGNSICDTACPVIKSIKDLRAESGILTYLRHRDGRRIPVELSVVPVIDEDQSVTGCIQVFHDVSERLLREKALEEKTKSLQAVLNSIKDGVLFIDGSGIIRLYNRALVEMFSIREDISNKEIFALPRDSTLWQAILSREKGYTGKKCYEFFGDRCPANTECIKDKDIQHRCWICRQHTTTPLQVATYCRECLVYKEVKSYLEQPVEVEIADRYISIVSSFIESEQTEGIWEVIVFRDVTETKRDAVVKLAAAAAHELRQPMQAIIGAVELLIDSLKVNDEINEYLTIIEKSCYRMDRIIEDIARITRFKLKEYPEDMTILDIKGSSENRTDLREDRDRND